MGSVGVLTVGTPSLALHFVHVHALTSLQQRVPGPLEVNVHLYWNMGRLVRILPPVCRWPT